MKRMSERQAPELEDLIEKYMNEAIEAGKKWADAKAFFESLDDKRKPELARLMAKFEGSQAAKEQLALIELDWANFLVAVKAARELYLQAQVDYDMAKLKVDVIRSVMSTRREEMKRFSG